MGCVSSTLLNRDDDFSQIGSTSLGHHIVSLTSTTYGLLTLDPPSSSSSPTTTTATSTLPPTPPRFTLGSLFPSPLSEPPAEVINSWELMAGLDSVADSFRFPTPPFKNKENSNPNFYLYNVGKSSVFKPINDESAKCLLDGFEKLDSNPSSQVYNVCKSNVAKSTNDDAKYPLDGFERLCPPNGENRVVIYTTSLRGVRKTFEACNAVRAAIEGNGVAVCERDVSMDRGFREELRDLMMGKESGQLVPPRVFVKGRYVGGAEEFMRIVEDGCLGELLEGLPKLRVGSVCEGCGGGRFLPCFGCNGSCKMVMVVKEEMSQKQGRTVVVRCPDCNENGLVLCPICS